MDVHSKAQRSHNMSKICNKDTKPEMVVRRLLWANGFRYRLHSKNLPGKPDIVFSGKRKMIFINGCFWHRHDCGYFKWPKTNQIFWKEKIEATILRDNENFKKLQQLNWQILIVWECEIKKLAESELLNRLNQYLE